MKFALNGALTIGTLDGSNIEIMEEVGRENFFLFGKTAAEVSDLRQQGYNPREIYNRNMGLKKALDMIAYGAFSPSIPELFRPLVESLLDRGDQYLVLADFESYRACQEEAGRLFSDRDEWTRRCILNTAGMGKFSTDRTIAEYAEEIWDVHPVRSNRKNGKNNSVQHVDG